MVWYLYIPYFISSLDYLQYNVLYYLIQCKKLLNAIVLGIITRKKLHVQYRCNHPIFSYIYTTAAISLGWLNPRIQNLQTI
jgi:hypothetical protein